MDPFPSSKQPSHPGLAAVLAGLGAIEAPACRLPSRAFAVVAEHRRAFESLLLDGDESALEAFVLELLEGGASAEEIMADLIVAAAEQLGRGWERDDLSFFDVTFATNRLHRILNSLHAPFLAEAAPRIPKAAGPVLLGCLPGEQHTLGIVMAAQFLVRDGWSVEFALGNDAVDIPELLARTHFTVLGLTLSSTDRIDALRELVRRAREGSRNPELRVFIGGPLVTERPQLALEVGADAAGVTAWELPDLLRDQGR